MNKSTQLFELIHTNIWGPAPIISHSGHRYIFIFLIIIVNSHGILSWNPNMTYWESFECLVSKLKTSLDEKLNTFDLMEPKNFSLTIFSSNYRMMVLFTEFLVLMFHNKTVLLNANTVTLSIWDWLFLILLMFLPNFGIMLLKWQSFSSIDCLLDPSIPELYLRLYMDVSPIMLTCESLVVCLFS